MAKIRAKMRQEIGSIGRVRQALLRPVSDRQNQKNIHCPQEHSRSQIISPIRANHLAREAERALPKVAPFSKDYTVNLGPLIASDVVCQTLPMEPISCLILARILAILS